MKWEDKLDKDEWYFSNSFESITKEMSPEEAFNYIPNVIEVLLKLDDDLIQKEGKWCNVIDYSVLALVSSISVVLYKFFEWQFVEVLTEMKVLFRKEWLYENIRLEKY